MISKIKLRPVVLEFLVVSIILVWAGSQGAGAIYDNYIIHDFPTGYFASDSYWFYHYSTQLYDSGSWKYMPYYITVGYDDIIASYPPVLFHISVAVAHMSGMKPYDSFFFVSVALTFLCILTVYLLIRRFNRLLALLALPFMTLVFAKDFALVFLYGWTPHLISALFVILSIYVIHVWRFSKPILLSIFLAALFMTQGKLFTPFLLFIAGYFIYLIATKKITKKEIGYSFITGAVFLTLTSYFLVIAKATWAYENQMNAIFISTTPLTWGGGKAVLFSDFGILAWLIIAGGILSVVYFKKSGVVLPGLMYLFLLGFSSYVLFGNTGLKLRTFWPLFFGVFAAFTLFIIIQLIFKKNRLIISTIVSILIMGFIVSPGFADYRGPGLMDQHHWDMFQWLEKNTDKTDKILFTFGDIYDQNAILPSAKRVPYFIHQPDLITSIQARVIKREYVTRMAVEALYQRPIITWWPFSIEKTITANQSNPPKKLMDICGFDFVVIDKITRHPATTAYNLILREELMKNSYIKEVYSNEAISILRNNELGNDCIEERKIE